MYILQPQTRSVFIINTKANLPPLTSLGIMFPQSFTVTGMDEGDATEHLEGAGPGWGFISAPQDLWVLLGRRRRKNVKNGNFSLSFSHNPVYKHVTGNGCQYIQTVKHLLKYLHTYGFSFPQNPDLEGSPRLFLTNDTHAVFFPSNSFLERKE